jgi:hypothetical protein
MRQLIGFGLYAFLSIGLGTLFCIFFTWGFNSARLTGISALVFFGGPIFLGLWTSYEAERDERRFKEDVAYVQELCAKYGGDKVYKTVDDVEGVFQINPQQPVSDELWGDPQGMPDPWGRAQLDSENPAIGLSAESKKGYWFLEQHIGMHRGPPYKRRFSTRSSDPGVSINALRSRYGYFIEDISTPEMRKRWIAGGRIKIIDLQTRELIAERTGYFRAIGSEALMSWSGSSAYLTDRMCPNSSDLDRFLKLVLKPVQGLPTADQLKTLKEE